MGTNSPQRADNGLPLGEEATFSTATNTSKRSYQETTHRVWNTSKSRLQNLAVVCYYGIRTCLLGSVFRHSRHQHLQRERTEDASWPENFETVPIFPRACLIGGSIHINTKSKNKNFVPSWAPRGAAMLVRSLQCNRLVREKAGSWRFSFCYHACRPYSWRHWYKLLGTKWQHSWSCFGKTETAARVRKKMFVN